MQMLMPNWRLFAMSTGPRTKSLIEGNLNWLNTSIGWAPPLTVHCSVDRGRCLFLAEVFVCCSFLAAQWFGIVLEKKKWKMKRNNRCRVGRLPVVMGGSPPRCVGCCIILSIVACFEVFMVQLWLAMMKNYRTEKWQTKKTFTINVCS